jgi:hypothetical protein
MTVSAPVPFFGMQAIGAGTKMFALACECIPVVKAASTVP